MKARTLWTKAAAGLGTVALAFFMTACSHHTSLAEGTDYGNIRTEQTAQQNETTPGNTVATAPAPANTQGTEGNPGTPAIIPGPAKVDNTGRVYTSSSVGSAGNSSSTGLNTNVNIVPQQSQSTVTVTQQTPAPAPIVTETTTTTEVTTPAPAPTYTPAPVVEAPMTSSTTVQEQTTTTETKTTTKTHKRMRKD